MIAKQLKVGMVIMHNGALHRVMSTQIIAPGNWRAFVQTKLRNIIAGSQTEYRFRTDETVERAILDNQNVEFLYQDGDHFHFMDTESYEQFHIMKEDLGDAVNYLKSNMKLFVQSYDGKPIGIDLPATVTLKIVETEPNMRTATVTNAYKSAKLETGVTIQVPPFCSEGDLVEVDTSTGEYVGRGKA